MKIFTNDEINNQQPKETIEFFIDKFEEVRKSNNLYPLRGNKKGKDINYIVAFSADSKTTDYVIDIYGLKIHNIVPNEPVVLGGFTTYEGARDYVKDYFKKANDRKAKAYKEMKKYPFSENAKVRYEFIKSSCAMAKSSMCIVYVEKYGGITED